jgi:hypothetical protein
MELKSLRAGGNHRRHDDLPTVGQCQVVVQYRTQGVSHEAGQREHEGEPERAVTVAGGEKQ